MTEFGRGEDQNSLDHEKRGVYESMSPELKGVLDQYGAVFNVVKGLPSHRTHDHAITLTPEAKPVSVRPYQYVYHHKDEIEKQVGEMLSDCIIRHSTSPFSSPVILVKKKDG